MSLTGAGRFGTERVCSRPVGSGRAGDDAVRHRLDGVGAVFQRRLPAHDLVELLLVLLLVEELAARDAVDLRAQVGDAILVGELHLGLPGDQAGQHVSRKAK